MKRLLRKYPLAAIAVMLFTGFTAAAQNADSTGITTLLQQTKEHAAKANLYAEELDTYARTQMTWESHATQLNRMKEEVNELGKDVADLSAARAEGSPWQQDAIDKIDPILRNMADHLSSTIRYLGEHQNQVHMPPYRDYARANYEHSQKMLTMIDDYIDYAEAKAQSEALEQKLLVPSETAPGQE